VSSIWAERCICVSVCVRACEMCLNYNRTVHRQRRSGARRRQAGDLELQRSSSVRHPAERGHTESLRCQSLEFFLALR